MDSEKWLWPSENMDFEKVDNAEYQVEVKWSKKPFWDYKNLSYQFYNCGFQVFNNVIESGHDNVKSDMWFLTGIFMIRQSMELGLKALLCRICTKKSEIQSVFEKCCHNLSALWAEYYSDDKENYLTQEEKQWLEEYFISLELVDAQSDMFRFPFEDDFLSKYRNKFIDNVDVANNLLQASALIKKCIECGIVSSDDSFDNNLKPEFFIMASHGIGNCYLWQSLTDEGFHVKITGYIAVADFIFKNKELHNEEKLYPLMFTLRNALELCLKRLFYSRVEKGVSKHAFFSKRKSHLIKKDLWKNVKPVILYYASEQGQDTDLINIVEKQLDVINRIDKNGDNFRYPTSYSLEYRINNRRFDLKNIYEFMRALLNFFEGCDSMLDAIADYESEMNSYYSSYY
ncbi:hypothetical protein [Anaerotignum propionicum]|uniref:Uncharacterized protein n=1 Tax=Anaerotignum propionicum DSM 1682 TaxID=991789 RepID=A0A0X1U907_ANAPI|nr:hypothetical protein [Anaerotignum propionicum]AMJ41416.1 hypothetical protein CPRO_18320 [Anaerotignum propionicum DSM 1682]SHE67854.1 hypothetical protein SAMN02745151_01430 [[Clostridium] propionicum DSM 1682] [Anaerotignum propionicum DSM 1682]